MAGSNTYGNYRHQADACHAYQIAKKNGIPESQIILLAYDDIANNRENPFPGKMFNKPNGPDVYAGCKIDYKGKDVTKGNFIKVLTGDTSAPGPVLKSTASDRVFVYFADHGGVGILGVPDGAAGGYIHAKDVNNALETMHSKGMYKELLFYIEACESGSIFKGLLKAPSVFAVTAANAKESSWGYYCPPQDKVNGKSIGSCLGDEFSIRWMEDADVANFMKETVLQQVQKVTTEVKKSHVSQFGDSSTIGGEVIGDFEGTEASRVSIVFNSSLTNSKDYSDSAVDSRDVEIHLAYYQMLQAKTLEEKLAKQEALAALLAKRAAADDRFMSIATAVVGGDKAKARAMIIGELESLGDVECHVQALEVAVNNCGPMDDYTMRYSRLFANLCNSFSKAEIGLAVRQVCKGKKADVVV
jgi:legumain